MFAFRLRCLGQITPRGVPISHGPLTLTVRAFGVAQSPPPLSRPSLVVCRNPSRLEITRQPARHLCHAELELISPEEL